MIPFLIKSAITMALLLGIYYLLLEREKMHRFNRFYLLGALMFSFAVPFITIPFYVYAVAPVGAMIPVANNGPAIVHAAPQMAVQAEINYWPYILGAIYATGVLMLGIRFGLNIIRFYRLKKRSATVAYKNATLVLLKDAVLPHTFLNNIYLNKTEYENRHIEPELFTHELAHVRQRHTLDILFIELLKTVFWFNPVLYLYKKAIQLNHEFLADETTVKNHLNITNYQQMLLDMATPATHYALASSINFSITKKRFIMMTKTTTSAKRAMLQAALLPILVCLTMLLCYKVVAQEKMRITHDNVRKIDINPTTQKQIDSLKKANPKQYADATKENYSVMKTTYTDDKGKEVVESKFEKKPDQNLLSIIVADGSPEPDVNSIKSMRVEKFTDKQSDSVKKTLPNLPKDYDVHLGKIVTTYVDDNGQLKDRVTYVYENENAQAANTAKAPADEKQEIYATSKVDRQAEFPGGISAFMKAIYNEFKIPDLKEDAVRRIYVSFIIETDGSMSNFKVLRDPGYGLGDEALRVLNKIDTKWAAATIGKKRVRTLYNLPITVNIKN